MAYWQDVEKIEVKQFKSPQSSTAFEIRFVLIAAKRDLLSQFEEYWPETEWEDAEPLIEDYMSRMLQQFVDRGTIQDYRLNSNSGWQMIVSVRTVDREEFQGDWVRTSAHLQQTQE